MKRSFLYLVFFVLGIFVIFKIFSLFESQEEKIRKIILSAKNATEKEQIIRCMSYVSNAYSDKDGNNKASLFRISKHVFKVYDSILIEITDLEISLIDKTKASAHAICIGRGDRVSNNRAKFETHTQEVEFQIIFRKEDNNWKVIELKFIDPEDFLKLIQGM